jgi:hypothetical protein
MPVILNAYAVLDGFVSVLRLGLGLLVVWIAFFTWKHRPQLAPSPEGHKALEDRLYLLFLLAGLSLALNILAWPLFYLLLQSYVSEWPGVMCIYGVTRIGAGSLGSSRFLPPLVTTLQASKLLIVFLSGAWFVIYLLNRSTRTAPLTGRVLLLLMTASLLATADATAEVAYLVIPKKEVFLSSGCCVSSFDPTSSPSRFVPQRLLGEHAGPWLYAAYYAVNGALIVALGTCARLCRRRFPAGWLAPLLAATLLSWMVNAAFLVEVAAPRLLHMPNHHCPYDLVSQAPRGVAAIALFVVGSFFVGWGCAVGWLGNGPESRPLVPGLVGSLFRLGALGYFFSVLILSGEMALAGRIPPVRGVAEKQASEVSGMP